MNHENFKEYTLAQLYEALDSVDAARYPGQLTAIEARIAEIEGASTNELQGIGGWLVLVAIGLVTTPIRISWMMVTTYPELFSTDRWEFLTTQGGGGYSPVWAPLIIGEIVVNAALVLAGIVTAYKFFGKRKEFPRWYLSIAAASLCFVITEMVAMKLVQPEESFFVAETIIQMVSVLAVIFIWVPYMLFSKRVKATFVR